MDRREKLAILADAAKYDASCASSGSNRKRPDKGLGSGASCGICHSFTPDGRCVSLLKILLTNYCIYDCLYCINRISSDVQRARFSVEEVVDLTLEFYRRNFIEGLFLSSGIIRSPDYTMEQMIEAARRLRVDHRFGGYIHLKTIPNASSELTETAGLYADRLSINIELPTPQKLLQVAPAKQHETIEAAMSAIEKRITDGREDKRTKAPAPRFAPAGQSTQMIIGAAGESDRQILEKASSLYADHKLRRVYYSAFSPIPHPSPLLPVEAAPLVRENRLYQADWLLRYYQFTVDEIVPGKLPDLAANMDPKLAWALRHPEFFPVNINGAERAALLRVPGLGVRSVNKIVAARRQRRIRFLDLGRFGCSLKKIEAFISTDDHTPAPRALDRLIGKVNQPQQLPLFPDVKGPSVKWSAISGEL